MVVRTLVGDLRLIAAAPSLHPFEHLAVAPQFVALTPLQAAATLEVPKEKRLLASTDCVILGGGSVSQTLEENLQSCKGSVYSTYGMTETPLSYCSFGRINGAHRSGWIHAISWCAGWQLNTEGVP